MKCTGRTILLLLCTLAVRAQTLNVDIPYQKFTLPNGLTVLVHEDHKAPVVAVNVWYHVGSKNEKPGKTGFAHLFEHLMFGGSENVKDRIINVFERVGATDLNGTTNEDRTNYFETVPVNALDYTLFVESDRMGHLLNSFDKSTLDIQRGVVQNEKRQDENQPYAVSEELITDATWPAKHPYSWTVIGSMEDLSAASLEDVKTWFRTYYGPSNATLAIAGDITVEAARNKVEKYFGELPPGPPVAHFEAWVPKMSGARRQRVEDHVPLARLYKVWNVPGWGSRDEILLRLAARVLAEGRDSRLYKRLVYDEQVASAVSAFVDSREIASQFRIQATAKSGVDLSRVERLANEELARLITAGPTPEELQRVSTSWVAQTIRGFDRVGGFGGKSDVLLEGQVYLGDPEAYRKQLALIQSATPADVQDAVRRWLSDGSFALEVRPFPRLMPAGTKVDRSKLPDAGAATDAKLPELQRTTLANGLTIVLAERHDLPVVDFSLVFDAGFASDQFAAPGASQLAMTLLNSGTKTRNALQLADELQLLGAQLNTGSSLDTSDVFLSAIKPKLDDSLALFADVVLNPAFPNADFEREKKLLLARIEQEKAQPFGIALRVMPPLIYGKGHAYGNPLTGSGTAESVGKLSREDMVKIHDVWFHPNGATLIVTGDTTMSEIQPKIEKLFTGWKTATLPKKNLATVAIPAKPVVYLIDKPGALQSYILAGQPATRRNAPGEIAADVMNDILGGNFNSRLNMNLREEKHWSYGVFSLFFDAKGQRPFLAIAPVQTDKTKESLAEVNRELHEIAAAKTISDVELRDAAASRSRSLAGSVESLQALSGKVHEIVVYGYPSNYYDTYAGKVRALRTAEVNDAAKSILHPDNLVWVVVGDRAKIEAGVRELNIGDVRILDADGNPK